MGYQALLFCADEKAIPVVSQVLSELDFHVELSAEPFSSVKRLTTEHFDAVVVDCDDEQNAALLFKAARNSEHNNASLIVALVQGQGGIAKAFKIGANLILTKPINAEQSKGTLRVARGMLRKTEAGKAAAAGIAKEQSASPLSMELSASSAALAEASSRTPERPTLQAQPETADLSAEIALAVTSAPEPVSSENKKSDGQKQDAAETGDLQTKSKAAGATAPTAAPTQTSAKAEGLSKAAPAAKAETQAIESGPAAKASGSGQKTGAAVARAKETPAPAKEASAEKTATTATIAPKKSEPANTAATAKKESGKAEAPKNFSWSDAARDQEALGSGHNKYNFAIAAGLVLALAAAGYFAWPTLEPLVMNIPVVQKYLGQEPPAPEAVVPRTLTPPAPTALTPAAGQNAATTGTAPAGTAGAPAVATGSAATSPEAPAPAPLSLAQTVADQLLVKKTAAVYPAEAKQKKLAGDVQLQAIVGKDGSVTEVKVLSGDETLAHAATDAVRQWKYKPYVLNGQPAVFETPVTVSFKSPH